MYNFKLNLSSELKSEDGGSMFLQMLIPIYMYVWCHNPKDHYGNFIIGSNILNYLEQDNIGHSTLWIWNPVIISNGNSWGNTFLVQELKTEITAAMESIAKEMVAAIMWHFSWWL